jgi:hypothetical protein
MWYTSTGSLVATALLALVAAVSGCGESTRAADPSAPSQLPPSFLVSVPEISVGGFSMAGVGETLADAITYFGRPTTQQNSERGFSSNCILRWADLGFAVAHWSYEYGDQRDNCDPTTDLDLITLTDRRWHTERGLRVGDRIGRLRRLYPRAPHGPGGWYLRSVKSKDPRTDYSRFRVPGRSALKRDALVAVAIANGRVDRIVVAGGRVSADMWLPGGDGYDDLLSARS